MDKYKIVKTEEGKWLVLTRDYFWQKWHPYTFANGEPVVTGEDEPLAFLGLYDFVLVHLFYLY